MVQAEININNVEFSELVESIYEAPFNKDWAKTFALLANYTKSDVTSWCIADLKNKVVIASFISEFKAAHYSIIDSFVSQLFDEQSHLLDTNELQNENISINLHLELTRMKQQGYHESILLPIDSGRVLVGALKCNDAFSVLFVFNRDYNGSAYTSCDINLLSMLTPHYKRALHLYSELKLYKEYASINKSIVEQTNKALLICDERANILISNSLTEEVFIQIPEISERHGKLAFADAKTNSAFLQLIFDHTETSFGDVEGQRTLIFPSSSNQEVLIEFSLINVESDFNTLSKMFWLVSIKLQKIMPWKTIQKEYGLTNREVQILEKLLLNYTLSQIASDLDIAYQTVRNHMQNIYRKSAVNSQTQLMQKLSFF